MSPNTVRSNSSVYKPRLPLTHIRKSEGYPREDMKNPVSLPLYTWRLYITSGISQPEHDDFKMAIRSIKSTKSIKRRSGCSELQQNPLDTLAGGDEEHESTPTSPTSPKPTSPSTPRPKPLPRKSLMLAVSSTVPLPSTTEATGTNNGGIETRAPSEHLSQETSSSQVKGNSSEPPRTPSVDDTASSPMAAGGDMRPGQHQKSQNDPEKISDTDVTPDDDLAHSEASKGVSQAAQSGDTLEAKTMGRVDDVPFSPPTHAVEKPDQHEMLQYASGNNPDEVAAGPDARLKSLHTVNVPDGRTICGKKRRETLRFLLVGKSGSGKSTTGNTILGEKKFPCGLGFSSLTQECQVHRVELNIGKEKEKVTVEVMDCPGLYDTSKEPHEVAAMIVQVVAFMDPGPHAILFIVSAVNRYTEEEHNVYKRITTIFDENVTNHIILVFTHGDELEREKKSFHDLLDGVPPRLARVLTTCKSRSLVFNNFAKNKKPQVENLLRETRKLVQENGGPYECTKYRIIQDEIKKEVKGRFEEMEERDLMRKKQIKDMEEKLKEKEAERKQLLELLLKTTEEKDAANREQREKLQALENELAHYRKLQTEREEERERRYQEDLETMRYNVARNEPPAENILKKGKKKLLSILGKKD